MVNTNRLWGKIVENNQTVETLADVIGINRSTFYRKISGKGQGFTVREASEIVRALNLTPTEAVSIFFDLTVA